LRAATGVLESDRVFSRHEMDASYRLREGHSRLDIRFLAGQIGGVAPIFERFVLGNSRLLRGWNKFDLVPLGASHVVHGTLEYSYRGLLLFYDTGAIWDKPAQREQKNSLGIGFRSKDGFQLAVAFPVRNGSVDPIFYIGAGF
jgi:outer membrane protein assembly factor BamA